MEGTMKAMVLTGRKTFEYREVPIPRIGPKDILFKVSYASICGMDLPIYNDLHYVQHLPIITGHEFTGYVVEVGSEVRDIPVGMRFMGSNIEWCGECEDCKAGNVFNCSKLTNNGYGAGRDGVFAEYCVLHNAMLNISVFPLPDSINDLEGATCEPMCVGIGNIETYLKPQDGERIVIYGAGMIGQTFIQAFKATCKCEIIAVDVSDLRLELARQSGADHVVNPLKGQSGYEKATELWGYGVYSYHSKEDKVCGNATIAVECTSNMGCVSEAMEVVGRFGRVCYAAGYGDEDYARIRPLNMMLKQVKIFDGYAGNFKRAVECMADGTLFSKHLITHVFPLEQLDEAIHVAMDAGRSCKVCIKVDPNAPDYPYNRQD